MSTCRAPSWQRALATAVCAYEVVALWSSLPTITNAAHRHPWLGAAIVGGLSHHFLPTDMRQAPRATGRPS